MCKKNGQKLKMNFTKIKLCIFFILIVLINSIRSQANEYDAGHNFNENDLNLQPKQAFLCDYYVKHVNGRTKTSFIDDLKDTRILGIIRLNCDDTLSIRKELFEIFKESKKPKHVLDGSKYYSYDKDRKK